MNQITAVAMSGGVDSSAAALLLQREGLDLAGVTLELTGCGQGGAEDAQAAAQALNIPHYLFDLTGPFREEVIQPFIQAYEEGLTPNPCVMCNRRIKFGALLELAQGKGWGRVATGHYARLDFDAGSGRWLLKKAAHLDKDQSYVLAMLTQEQLARALFPLGELAKEEVRALAAQAGLANAHKGTARTSASSPTGTTALSSANIPAETTRKVPFCMRTGPCWAGTEASSDTPWASAGGWGCPPDGEGCM